MILIVLVSLLASVGVLYYFFKNRYAYWPKRGVKQTDVVWVLGDNYKTVLRQESFADLVKRIYDVNRNERYTGFYQMLVPTLLIRDPDLLKQICVKDFDHFVDHRAFIPEDCDPLWAKNLFALTGQRWREMRPILSPSFTSSKMRAMFLLMEQCSKRFVDFFKNKKEDLISVELKDLYTRYCNDVIATCAFGIEVDSLNEPNNRFYLMGKEATNFSSTKKTWKFFGYFLVPWLYKILRISFFDEEVKEFFYKLVDDTIRIREEKGIVRPDMINLLMEARKGKARAEEEAEIDTGFSTAHESKANVQNGKPSSYVEITNQDIAAQAMVFFFGGFDSVSSLMCFMTHELCENPDIQSRLREEIRETHRNCKGKLTYEALLKMKYMDMVVSESLRKWPNAVGVDRVCTKPYTIEPTKPGEPRVHLQKGDVVWMPIYGMHHDFRYYPNPERFDPERFNDENKDKIQPYTYIPFGIGPRNCIGSRFALLETKAVIYHLLSCFEVVPTEKTQIPLRLTKASFNMMGEKGFWVGLRKLDKNEAVY